MVRLTFLGTGTSQGVPMIGCNCEVCRSTDPHDHRLRTSAMIETDHERIIIDAGPDFRYQMLREGVQGIDAILLTHPHKDHIGGIDDVRAFNYFQHRAAAIYATEQTANRVRSDFDYAFSDHPYPGVPSIDLRIIDPNHSFLVGQSVVTPINGHHYKMPVTGFRIGKLAYLTDFNHIEQSEVRNKLVGLDVLVVNALRHEEHLSHFSLSQAVELAEQVGAKECYLTHMSHQIGLYAQQESLLPAHIHFAYDRLRVTAES